MNVPLIRDDIIIGPLLFLPNCLLQEITHFICCWRDLLRMRTSWLARTDSTDHIPSPPFLLTSSLETGLLGAVFKCQRTFTTTSRLLDSTRLMSLFTISSCPMDFNHWLCMVGGSISSVVLRNKSDLYTSFNGNNNCRAFIYSIEQCLTLSITHYTTSQKTTGVYEGREVEKNTLLHA